jgi:fructose-bisphosphate aldolase/6-deoxy-5-ketofructose 1-phosphate synthase
MFACDQKMEHLNKDFYGEKIHPDALHIEHIFKIAQAGYIGALATNVGLIERYAKQYPTIPYIAKLNGKTDLIKSVQKDPYSKQLWTVDQAVALKKEHSVLLCGIGYTLFLGSEYEPEMLNEAAQVINDAHRNGLVTILWVYARGKSIKDDQDPELIAGAAGVAATLGADFVKLKAPHESEEKTSAQWLNIATQAAGNTKIICAGGSRKNPEALLTEIYSQLHQGNTAGSAIGRNIFQYSLTDAIAITKALNALIYENKTVQESLKIIESA